MEVLQFDNFIKKVAHRVYRKFGGQVEFDDILQEAYLIALAVWKNYDNSKALFHTYLQASLEKALIQKVIKLIYIVNTRTKDTILYGFNVNIEDKNPSLLQDFSAQEVASLLAKLTEKERFVVIKRVFEERGFKEIGQELGISKQAVHQIYKKAIQKLKTILQA